MQSVCICLQGCNQRVVIKHFVKMLLTFDPKNKHPPLPPLPGVAGVFGSMVLPSRPEVGACPEQEESINKASWEPPAGVYGHAVSGSHVDSDDDPDADEATVQRTFILH